MSASGLALKQFLTNPWYYCRDDTISRGMTCESMLAFDDLIAKKQSQSSYTLLHLRVCVSPAFAGPSVPCVYKHFSLKEYLTDVRKRLGISTPKQAEQFLTSPWYHCRDDTVSRGMTCEAMLAFDDLIEKKKYSISNHNIDTRRSIAAMLYDLGISRDIALVKAMHLFAGARNPDTASINDQLKRKVARKVQSLRTKVRQLGGISREQKTLDFLAPLFLDTTHLVTKFGLVELIELFKRTEISLSEFVQVADIPRKEIEIALALST